MNIPERQRQRVFDLTDAGIAQVEIARIIQLNVRTVRHIQRSKEAGKGV